LTLLVEVMAQYSHISLAKNQKYRNCFWSYNSAAYGPIYFK